MTIQTLCPRLQKWNLSLINTLSVYSIAEFFHTFLNLASGTLFHKTLNPFPHHSFNLPFLCLRNLFLPHNPTPLRILHSEPNNPRGITPRHQHKQRIHRLQTQADTSIVLHRPHLRASRQTTFDEIRLIPVLARKIQRYSSPHCLHDAKLERFTDDRVQLLDNFGIPLFRHKFKRKRR